MTRRTPARLMMVALVLVALVLAGCGGDDDDGGAAGSGTRTVEIEMRDIAFSPDQIDVRAGETVRFVFNNVGKVRHDAFIGDEAAQEEHEMEMREGGTATTEMGMEHGEEGGGEAAGGITVEPGETGELTHTFEEGDELLIGCHEAGHYAAGMKITIDVS